MKYNQAVKIAHEKAYGEPFLWGYGGIRFITYEDINDKLTVQVFKNGKLYYPLHNLLSCKNLTHSTLTPKEKESFQNCLTLIGRALEGYSADESKDQEDPRFLFMKYTYESFQEIFLGLTGDDFEDEIPEQFMGIINLFFYEVCGSDEYDVQSGLERISESFEVNDEDIDPEDIDEEMDFEVVSKSYFKLKKQLFDQFVPNDKKLKKICDEFRKKYFDQNDVLFLTICEILTDENEREYLVIDFGKDLEALLDEDERIIEIH